MKLPKIITALCCLMLTISCQHKISKGKYEKEENEKTGAREALERDVKMMTDPSLGYVPAERLLNAKQYKDQLLLTDAALSGVNWRSLGPKNQGGRSRTMLIDANDATGNTVFSGSVGGGLWRTTNISAASPGWAPVDDLLGNLAVTSIAQDPSNPLVMYFCTGEGYFNADAIRGLGVWKSTNGGASWSQLSSTNNTNFSFCQKVVVNSTGVVMVSTSTGLRRSTDGGTTFTKVLGTGLGITGAVSNMCYDIEIAANGDVYATLNGSVHKSTNAGSTWAAAQTLPIAVSRVELACAPSDANYVYALCENGNVVAGILKTTNGGTTWTAGTEPDDLDAGIPATDFSRSQAWYDLSVAVDPNNRDRLFVGGIDVFVSNDAAATWTQVSHWYGGFGSQYMHADQHFAMFKTGSSTEAYFTNDGGIYRSTNANVAIPTVTDKGANYITAQFYACAMHPTALTSYFLAGAQDNGSHQFSSNAVQNTVQVTGGDGAYCHIDQDQPQYQFTSYVYNDYYLSADGGSTWTNVTHSGSAGQFINPTDYDDVNNRMYACRNANQYVRWDNPQTGSTFTQVAVAGFGGQVSAIKVSPNTANRVFFGIDNGDVFRVDNAHTGAPTATNISTGLPAAYLNCIEVQTGDDNHLLAMYTNYGVNSIWESTNGGTSWTSVEGNLPDMPIRWALFNPNNSDQAIIATELGVWSTDDLNGASTVWGASNSGLANVRVDMLQLRTSDKLVVAATHGRGLFSSDIFTNPTALFDADLKTTYTGKSINFTSTSYKGTSWSWDFGDGGNSTSENPSHVYASPGKYNVTLTINSGASALTKTQFIHVLPNRGTPYQIANGGGFELNTDDFGVDQVAGTPWERGNSAVAGKNSTHAGSNAWVTGLAAATYADNGETNLMTPNYNFTLPGTYTLTFWAKYNTETDFDGFRVEYSLDKGSTWLPLGTTVAAGWYTNANTSGTTSFPANEAFFGGNSSAAYTLRTRDLSFLAGNSNVAFRIRFRSDGSVNAAGAAIDDWEIAGPANVSLPLTLTGFTAYKNNADVMLKWNTQNEQNVSRFIVERSNDGAIFTAIGSMAARNLAQDEYTYPDLISQMPVRPSGYLYYRLRMVDIDGYYKYSGIARIAIEADNHITVGPNPFHDHLNIYAQAEIKKVSLTDMSGREVFRASTVVGNRLTIPERLPAGQYLLKIETVNGVETRKVFKE
jgi:PKD repeat protein